MHSEYQSFALMARQQIYLWFLRQARLAEILKPRPLLPLCETWEERQERFKENRECQITGKDCHFTDIPPTQHQ